MPDKVVRRRLSHAAPTTPTTTTPNKVGAGSASDSPSHSTFLRSTISPARKRALIPSSPGLLSALGGAGDADIPGEVITTSPPLKFSIFMC